MKEQDYVILFMTTYGYRSQMSRDQVRAFNDGTNIRKVRFNYLEVFHNHYHIWDSLDNHDSPVCI